MQDLKCPNCGASLEKTQSDGGIFFVCPSCCGRSAGLTLLRRLGLPWTYYDLLYQAGKQKISPSERDCPHCSRQMQTCRIPINQKDSLELDVCGICQQVWFDPSEFSKIPMAKELSDTPVPPMTPKAKELIALAEVKKVEERYSSMPDDMNNSDTSNNIMAFLLGQLGLPVEENIEPLKKTPYLTWGLSILMILVFLAFYFSGRFEALTDEWGFKCAQWHRHYGLTILSSFFMHAGFLHLLGNLYFFIVFGDNVEDRLGKIKFIILIFASHIFGLGVFYMFNISSNIVSVGASAGIAGIIAYYAMLYPQAKLKLCYLFFFSFRYFEIRVIHAFILFTVMQILGAILNFHGSEGGVNYLAHLGGLAVGVAAGFISILNNSSAHRTDEHINRKNYDPLDYRR